MSTQATPELEGYEDFVHFMLDGLTPEVKMMGLTPKERLVGLAPELIASALEPEQRLAGLALEHVALALSVEVLRSLSDDYVATLPDDVQREVRARRAR